jgi:uncharacterized protein (DUF1697 family)
MANYVALIRGVGPTNPNTRNDKLSAVLDGLGCKNIEPVLASGNLIFRSTVRHSVQLEAQIEQTLNQHLGLSTARARCCAGSGTS